MDKTFDPNNIETKWSQHWESEQYYQPQSGQQAYSITLPPPNVTGTLHMGHGFQMTLMDALIRRERMLGKRALWQPGTDHAGIATQMVVERELSKENLSRHDLGRETFIDRVWQWREQSGSTITKQIRRLGASLDWSRERFSMDESLSHATTEAFIRLYEDGLIYRGKRLVNWDPKLHTAISDLEVINKESNGSLWHIRYPLSNSNEHLVVATTRPETMLGDTAVAVHPEDERYQHLIGQTIALPLTNRSIPIIADEEVDREFGTGCVKITPAHDFNDYEMGKRHDLPMLNIMTFDGHLNNETPEQYQGLERFAARKQIIADLKEQALLEKIEPHALKIPMGDRSGVVIEPMLTDQWFIKMESLAKPAIDALHNGDLKLVPNNWDKTYLQWLENIQDWCISRQLWWGHRIPVWYDDQNNHYTGHDEQDVRTRHNIPTETTLKQDNDVLDTWFTAALCPFSSLGWPNKTPDLTDFYPNSVLVTGFDIIFFWVARMVMMGLYFCKQVPFKEVYIHGLIRDSQGHKMSKSKGNVLDPVDLIDGIDLETLVNKRTRTLMQPQMAEKINKQTRKEFPNGIAAYGTDALRFTYCALASTGRDINFDMGRMEGYRNFCNKIWNATRFVLMQLEDHKLDLSCQSNNIADLWINQQLNITIAKVNIAFSQYRFDLLAQYLYEFIWNEYCDWYVELAKCTLNHPNFSATEKNATRVTLLTVLETVLRLLHPITPFMTEEIFQTISPLLEIQCKSIMLRPYPIIEKAQEDTSEIQKINWLKEMITCIRNIRGEIGISPAKKVNLICYCPSQEDHDYITNFQQYIVSLGKIDQLSMTSDKNTLPPSATGLVNSIELHIPLAGAINKDQELARLDKEIAKLEKELSKCQQKLNNKSYIEKAPEAVIAKEKQKRDNTLANLDKLKKHHQGIEAL